MEQIKFEKLLKTTTARSILLKHYKSKIRLNSKQLDVIIAKKKLEN